MDLNSCRPHLQLRQRKISRLESHLAEAISSTPPETALFQTPADHIFADIIAHRRRHPNAQRYSMPMLRWASDLLDTSPVAFQIIRVVVLLPSDKLLREIFVHIKNHVSAALTDLGAIKNILALWLRANPVPEQQIAAVPVIDAVDVKPLITVSEDGDVSGVDGVSSLEMPDLRLTQISCSIQSSSSRSTD
jgi:hypothetical protein